MSQGQLCSGRKVVQRLAHVHHTSVAGKHMARRDREAMDCIIGCLSPYPHRCLILASRSWVGLARRAQRAGRRRGKEVNGHFAGRKLNRLTVKSMVLGSRVGRVGGFFFGMLCSHLLTRSCRQRPMSRAWEDLTVGGCWSRVLRTVICQCRCQGGGDGEGNDDM